MKVYFKNAELIFSKVSFLTKYSLRSGLQSSNLNKTYSLVSWYDEGSGTDISQVIYKVEAGKTYKVRSYCNNKETTSTVYLPAYALMPNGPEASKHTYTDYGIGSSETDQYEISEVTPTSDCYLLIIIKKDDEGAENTTWYCAEM